MSEELKRRIPKGIPIGKVEFSEKEIIDHNKAMERILKQIEVLAENETLDDLKKDKK